MHRVETVTVEGSPMEVFLFAPRGDGPHPAILLAQHIPGGHTGLENDPFSLETAERYAAHGYAVAVPFIFHWWPKEEDMMVKAKSTRDDWTVADLRATQQLLEERADVDSARIGIVGHCWGGRGPRRRRNSSKVGSHPEKKERSSPYVSHDCHASMRPP